MPLHNVAAEADVSEFRNGIPCRFSGWISIRIGKFSLKKSRFAKLYGEVFSIHQSEHWISDEELDMRRTTIEYVDSPSRKSFRLLNAKRVFTCYCGTFEEMAAWIRALEFASGHNFLRYYAIGALISEGSFSKVYYAYALENQSKVFAVKVIKRRPFDSDAMEMLHKERYVNSVLNHSNIVQAVDMFSTIQRDYLVFELMPGGTLADLLTRKRNLPDSYARVVMRELLIAICHIHSKNIVHRDIRPANVFCSSEKFPMSIALGEFRFSDLVSAKRVNLDVLKEKVGTPPYMAPEMVRGEKYGPPVDMWSAGIVLYEMLSGQTPFEGVPRREMLQKIQVGDIQFGSSIWLNISGAAKSLILQLLQPNQNKRISALGALNHRWMEQDNISPPVSADNSSPGMSSYTASPGLCDGSSSEISPPGASDRERKSHRHTSLLGQSSSMIRQASLVQRSSPRTRSGFCSTPSFNNSPRTLPLTPSVVEISNVGLQRVASKNPSRIRSLLSSSIVQKQLSSTLTYRRKLLVTMLAFVAVFRLRALTKGQSTTKLYTTMEMNDADTADALIDERIAAVEERREEYKNTRLADRDAGPSLPLPPTRGHIRQRSRDMAMHLIDRLSLDRKQPEPGLGN